MKRVKLFFALATITSTAFSQDENYNDWLLKQRLPDWAQVSFDANIIDYKLSDFINPFYIEADFNGDDKIDIAISIQNAQDQKKGLVIIHQSTDAVFIIGAGKKFDHFDDMWWMDILKVNYGLNEHELTYTEDGDIDGSRSVTLLYPSIYVGKSESLSGLIYWSRNEYKWIQTSD